MFTLQSNTTRLYLLHLSYLYIIKKPKTSIIGSFNNIRVPKPIGLQFWRNFYSNVILFLQFGINQPRYQLKSHTFSATNFSEPVTVSIVPLVLNFDHRVC